MRLPSLISSLLLAAGCAGQTATVPPTTTRPANSPSPRISTPDPAPPPQEKESKNTPPDLYSITLVDDQRKIVAQAICRGEPRVVKTQDAVVLYYTDALDGTKNAGVIQADCVILISGVRQVLSVRVRETDAELKPDDGLDQFAAPPPKDEELREF